MRLDHWLVIAGAVALIGWVYWYFFLAGRPQERPAAKRGAE